MRQKLLRELLQRRVIVNDHLAQAVKRGVHLVLAHLVGSVKQPDHGLPVVNAGEKDNQLDVDDDKLQVEEGHVEVDQCSEIWHVTIVVSS